MHDDGGETLTLTLSNASNARIADGTATGTIENSDPIPQAWLARFGRTVADQVVDAVAERLKGSPGGGSQVTLGGQKIPLDGAAKGASRDGAAAAGKARDALAAFADRVRHERRGFDFEQHQKIVAPSDGVDVVALLRDDPNIKRLWGGPAE